MTWRQLKKRMKELGVRDSDQLAIDSIDDDGFAFFRLAHGMRLTTDSAAAKGNPDARAQA